MTATSFDSIATCLCQIHISTGWITCAVHTNSSPHERILANVPPLRAHSACTPQNFKRTKPLKDVCCQITRKIEPIWPCCSVTFLFHCCHSRIIITFMESEIINKLCTLLQNNKKLWTYYYNLLWKVKVKLSINFEKDCFTHVYHHQLADESVNNRKREKSEWRNLGTTFVNLNYICVTNYP